MTVQELIYFLEKEIKDKEQVVYLQVSTSTYGMESNDIEDISERQNGGVVISGPMTEQHC